MASAEQSRIKFLRMHGCGNDYVFIDCLSASAPQQPGRLAQQLSDRNRSVGGDGLVLILPSVNPANAARMQMFNADGTEGRLCGNAIRCLAMWLHQERNAAAVMTIEMAAQQIRCQVTQSRPDEKTARVCLTLPPPRILSPAASGFRRYVRSVAEIQQLIPEQEAVPLLVDVGNLHLIVPVADMGISNFEQTAKILEHKAVPGRRVNVEFVASVVADRCEIRIWERGTGETQSCGSGACAVAVAGTATQWFQQGDGICVRSPGGPLEVRLDASDQIHLEGEAAECCRGMTRIH
jgi:diaminopimelate epimerase